MILNPFTTIVNYRIHFLAILFLSTLANCSTAEQDSDDDTIKTDQTTTLKEQDDNHMSTTNEPQLVSDKTEGDNETFKGFLGNSPITVFLSFDNNQGSVSGYYYYNEYKKEINLSGSETDWYGGPVYQLKETDQAGNITGTWEFLMLGDYGSYTGRFESPDGNTTLDIIIKSDSSGGYLHPESKLLFEDQADAKKFFATHLFRHNEVKHKSGIILHEPSQEEYMEGTEMLPTGITIYDHDGGDGFGVTVVGRVKEKNTIHFDSGDESKLFFDWDTGAMMEVDYGVPCLRFMELPSAEYVFVQTNETSFYLSIAELEQYGYHLEGDGHWLVERSGKVLGYYPNGTVTILEKKDIASKALLSVSTDEDGYFQVLDVVNFKREIWAKVTFDYFSEVPCDGTIKEPKPSVTGWTPLYYGTSKDQLRFGFYSRGC